MDHLFAITGVVPWRCGICEGRFHARSLPFRYLFFSHCGICGNLELKRISPEHVPGTLSFAGRILGFPAFRCEPCRNKFFSLRPLCEAGLLAEAGDQKRDQAA